MRKNSIIPAVKRFKELEKALDAPSEIIFLLEGEIIQLRNIVDQVKHRKKQLYVHLDLIKGIKEDEACIHFLAKDVKVDGIISTRTSSLLHGKRYGLITVQRGFLLDSHSITTIIKSANHVKPDFIELLPSLAFSRLKDIKQETNAEIIMGGFISSVEEIAVIFKAGASAVSTSRPQLWKEAFA